MKRFIRGSLFIIFTSVIIYLGGCNGGSCFEETESYLKASFYDNSTKTRLAPDSLSLHGLNSDSIIYKSDTNVQPALIPLNSSTDSCSFSIEINGVTDTIEFKYSSYPHLISKECGYTFYHHLDTTLFHTKHAIKDIFISNETITNLNVENIRIFY